MEELSLNLAESGSVAIFSGKGVGRWKTLFFQLSVSRPH
jgi:hypothetical protein